MNHLLAGRPTARVLRLEEAVLIGDHHLPLDGAVDLGPPFGQLTARALAAAAARYDALTAGACSPQLAAVVYDLTGQPRALDPYHPLLRWLPAPEQAVFDQQRTALLSDPHFALRLIGEAGADRTPDLPPTVAALVAGHILETFFFRPDILRRLFSQPRRFHLYTTQRAYAQDGGLAGGQYHAQREAVQLVLARLFEGFYGDAPGVAPFLHEFGHLLDYFDPATGAMRPTSDGLLPGLRPTDGAVFTPAARAAFLRGKRLELQRYLACQPRQDPPAVLPLGHPYVFQNDTEFCAGYFEMFFRNPHAFAAQNPELFDAYTCLLRQDPRPGWDHDFDFYLNANRAFYRSGSALWPTHLTVPEA